MPAAVSTRFLLAVAAALVVSGATLAATPQVVTGQSHSLAIDTNGRVFAWGSDSVGQLGQGSRLRFESPSVIAGLPPLQSVSARFQSVAALDRDGNVWTWGIHGLGERSRPDPARPARVLGITGVTRVESGFFGTGVLKGGQVWGWGSLAGVQSIVPVRFAALDGAIDIAVGMSEIVGLMPDGSVWQLGGADYGQFVTGTAPTSSTTARVAGLPAMARVYSFNQSSLDSRFAGIDQAGDAWVWGCWNAPGCSAAKNGAARKATGLPAKARALSLDYRALHAALETGATYRAILTNSLAASFSAFADFIDVKTLAGFDGTVYALRNSGTVDSIGFNFEGELGTGTVGGSSSTRQAVVGLADVVSIAAAQFAGYAVRGDGALLGWGGDFGGAISGIARFAQSLPHTVDLPGGAKAAKVATGARSSFAITDSGALYGWGDNLYATLGIGSEVDQAAPVLIPLSGVIDVAGGVTYTVIVRSDGSAWTNGAGGFGALAGIGNARRAFVPKHLDNYALPLFGPPDPNFIPTDAGFVLDASGVLHGFGYDYRGSGIFAQAVPYPQYRAPAPLAGLPLPVIDFSVASDHALALLSDGSVWAWGRNDGGQLGDGTTTSRSQPQPVPGLANVVAVSAGRCHSLALLSDGSVRSWGCNPSGELGDGTTAGRSTPAQVANLDGIARIAAGFHTSYAVRNGGLVFAWGDSSNDELSGGALGDGALVTRLRPVLVSRENSLGSADREDWFLDLDPATANARPAFTSRAVTTNTVAVGLQSVSASVIARADDVGKVAGIYVLGRVNVDFLEQQGALPQAGSAGDAIVQRAKAGNDFILAQLTPNGWSVVTGQLTAFVSGTTSAVSGSINILNNTPFKAGSRFCIGYGSDADRMLASQTLAEVLALPGASGSAGGFPCALSGVYVSGLAKSNLNTPVKFTATVVGVAPKGTVQLKDGEGALGPLLTLVTQNVAVSTATHVATGLSIGEHSIGAHYGGDTNNAQADVQRALPHVVAQLQQGTETTLTGNASSTLGDPVQFTATVNGNNPGGTVQLRDGGAALGAPVALDASGVARIPATGLAAGTHGITATYSGDALNTGSNSNTITHLVSTAVATTISLVASANPSTRGVAATLTATVAGNNPTGNVTFREDTQVLGSAPLAAGAATLSITSLAAGTHRITAQYGGDVNNLPVTSRIHTQAVQLPQPSAVPTLQVTSTANPAALAQSVQFTVAATGGAGTPTGVIEFRDNGVAIPNCAGARLQVSGTTGCLTNLLAPGAHSITAVYAGDAVYVPAVSPPLAQTVDAAGTQLLVASAATLDFGGVSMGTTSLPQGVTITNAGGSAVAVTSIAAPSLVQVSSDCTTLAPGASCQASMMLAPQAEGPLGAYVALSYAGGGPTVIGVVGTGERSLVTHYYRAVLRRAPDAGGKAFWEGEAGRLTGLDGNVNETWFAMAIAFFTSAEYAAFNRDTAGFVTDLYTTFFNRAPDGGGLGYWSAQIDSGMPREVVLASFMFSPEFQGFTQAIFGNTAARAELDAVTDFYRGLLARIPDNEGLAFWVREFRVAQCEGSASVRTQADRISSQFATGGEYLARNRSNAQYIGDLYNAFLRRGGDLQGVQYWIGQLATRTREDIRREFRDSPEFAGRVNAMIAQGCVR
jgi:alpha-tubulin suppressor-like RCC1 family protein